MSSRLFSIIRLSRMIVLVLFAGGMVACVDDNYDLNKDISMEVGIGGKYFAIPLGTTDSIRVDSLLELDDESVFMFMEDGTAVISKLDSVKVRVPEIQQVTLQSWASEIEPIVNEIEVPEEAQGVVGEVALPEKDVNSSTSIEFDEEVPEELLDLNTVKFDGTPKLVIDIQFEAPEEVAKLELMDYVIHFPEFIVFDDNRIENHCLVIDGEMDVDAGYHVELDIAEFDFAENPIQEVGSEKRLHIDGAVTLDGQLRVTVRGDGTLPGTVTVGIMPQVSIDEMKLGEITGKVNVDIEEVNEEVDLGDIPDFLKDKDVVLDIEHPVIMLEVGNTTGVPVLADLTLTPLADGNPIENGIIELRREERDIVVKAADEMGEYTWSNFFISNSEAGMEPGFEFVDVPNLPNLIRQIPDVIQIKMTAEADQGEDPEVVHRFDLSHGDYEMNVRYNVHVPLTFGPDLQVVYRDTIDDFNSDIKDYVKYVTEVVMEMEVENTIPLGMVCRAVALDVDGRALSGIEVSTPQAIEAAGWDGNNTTLVISNFTIELKETVAGTMEQLDGLALEITADANEDVKGASLKNNQYLRLSGKMRIPGGITVDIDDI